jgi:hypothetical protein
MDGIAQSTEPADSLVTIAEGASSTNRVWRIHYGKAITSVAEAAKRSSSSMKEAMPFSG